MTITTEANSVTYLGNGTTGPFPIGFRFLENSDIDVTLIDADGYETALTETTHYVLTGAGGSSGSLTLTTALAVGEEIAIVRNVDGIQLTDLRNQGAMWPETLEIALDRLTMLYNQVKNAVMRIPKAPVGEDAGTISWYDYNNRHGKVLGYNTLGQLVLTAVNYVTSSGLFANPWADVRGYADLATAVAELGGTSIELIVPNVQTVSENLTVPSNIRLTIKPGGKITVAAGKVFTLSPGSVDTVYPEDFGAAGDGLTDDYIALQTAVNAFPVITLRHGKIYMSSATIICAKDNILLNGHGAIITNGNDYTLVKCTGLKPTITGITLSGSATNGQVAAQIPNSTANRIALLEVNGSTLTARQQAVIDNVTINNPFETGIFLYKSIDAKINDSTLISTQTDGITDLSLATYLPHIYAYSCGMLDISNNKLFGMGEGIVVASDGVYNIDLFDGSTPEIYTRQHIINNNTVRDQVDHAIYMSNYCSEYTIRGNLLMGKTKPSLKLEGYNLTVTDNRIEQGIITRHISIATIANNIIYIHSAVAPATTYGILLWTDVDTIDSYTVMNSISMTGNKITCASGVGSHSGIYVIGSVLPFTTPTRQVTISNLVIANNSIKGFGSGVAEGSGIYINQQLIPGTPATGSAANNITITGNNIEMADVTAEGLRNTTYGINLRQALANVTITGNNLKSYSYIGILNQGASYLVVEGNIFIPQANATVTTRYGIYEVPVDTAAHFSPTYNKYGVNVWGGDANSLDIYKYQETSKRYDYDGYYVEDGIDFTLYPAYTPYNQVFHKNTESGKTLTLDPTGWPTNYAVTVYNVGSNAFTVTNGTISKSVAAGANIVFLHKTGGAFVTDK